MKLKLHRRHFLKSAGLLSLYGSGLIPTLSLQQAFAMDSSSLPHFFVLIQVPNGWDVTLGLDPKDHSDGSDQRDIFIEYQPDQILKSGGISLAPSAQALLPHAQDLLIINGIEMRRDAGHETNRDIMSSGYGDGITALFPIELAATLGDGPLGVLIDQEISLGQRNTMVTAFSGIDISGSGIGDAMELFRVDSGSVFADAQRNLIDANNRIPQLLEAVEKVKKAGINDEKCVKMAAAFLSGSALQASVSLSNLNLDTHSDHVGVHAANQSRGWNSVAEIFSGFKNIEYANGLSLFDLTTFYVVSEFSRTPYLNGGNGKDHNPHANSVLLAGKGIQGGRQIGKSFVLKKSESPTGFAQHISRPIDFRTGDIVTQAPESLEPVKLIFPEDLSATIGKLFGNPHDFYVGKQKGLVIPGVLS
jgi:hypothetical protein